MENTMNRDFAKARYIWKVGTSPGKPQALIFQTMLNNGSYRLTIAAATVYRLTVNGTVAGYGPARAPHGYARVDKIDLTPFMTRAQNVIRIDVVSYAIDNFYLPNGPGFIRAEITTTDGNVVRATGPGSDFIAYESAERCWNVEKLTYQRHLMESYDYTETDKLEIPVNVLPLDLKLLERGAPQPQLQTVFTARLYHAGFMRQFRADNPVDKPAERLKSYEWGIDIREVNPGYLLYDFGRNLTGFMKVVIECREDAEILIGHDEVLLEEVFTGHRAWWANNYIRLKLKKGRRIDFESFEPYTMRYLAVWILSGDADIHKTELREYAFPLTLIKDITQNKRRMPHKIGQIYQAAVETFRQNTLDTFMDCPGRERAAWLCDSFFTARSAYLLTGDTTVEESFIENFLLPENFKYLPPGMIPMCYPADTDHFIPQWPMWFILQIEEYLTSRNGKRNFPAEFKKRFVAFLEYFSPYYNEYGLLENLPGWNFIEWSNAKDYLRGVHFPTNLLFAECLKTVGSWYGNTEYLKQAEAIIRTVRKLAFNGESLYDNAVREDGMLKVTGNTSEIAQYFVLFFQMIPPKSAAWERLSMALFDNRHPACNKAPVNMFIGRLLRLELLRLSGCYRQQLDEINEQFAKMSEQTGTLWEKHTPDSSCCHGFASYVAILIEEACGNLATLCEKPVAVLV